MEQKAKLREKQKAKKKKIENNQKKNKNNNLEQPSSQKPISKNHHKNAL